MTGFKITTVFVAAVLLAPVASAKDNEGGGGGTCQGCSENPLTGDSWCVASASNLFGWTGCTTEKSYEGSRVKVTCVPKGTMCIGSTPLPGAPGYL
jgi:hypothetical protein